MTILPHGSIGGFRAARLPGQATRSAEPVRVSVSNNHKILPGQYLGLEPPVHGSYQQYTRMVAMDLTSPIRDVITGGQNRSAVFSRNILGTAPEICRVNDKEENTRKSGITWHRKSCSPARNTLPRPPEVHRKPMKYGYLHLTDTAVVPTVSALELDEQTGLATFLFSCLYYYYY